MSAARQALKAQQEERRRRHFVAQLLAKSSSGKDPIKPRLKQDQAQTGEQPSERQQDDTQDLVQSTQVCADACKILSFLRRKQPTAVFLTSFSGDRKGAGGASIIGASQHGAARHWRVSFTLGNLKQPVQAVSATTPNSHGDNALPTSQPGIGSNGACKLTTSPLSGSVAKEVSRSDIGQDTPCHVLERGRNLWGQNQTSNSDANRAAEQALVAASANMISLYGFLVGSEKASRHQVVMAESMSAICNKTRDQSRVAPMDSQIGLLHKARELHHRLTINGAATELRLKQLLAQPTIIGPMLCQLVSQPTNTLTSDQLRVVLLALRPQLLRAQPLWTVLTRQTGGSELQLRKAGLGGRFPWGPDRLPTMIGDVLAEIKFDAVRGVLLLAAAPEAQSPDAVLDKDISFLACAALGVLYRMLRFHGGRQLGCRATQQHQQYPSGAVLQVSPRLIYSLLCHDVFISIDSAPLDHNSTPTPTANIRRFSTHYFRYLLHGLSGPLLGSPLLMWMCAAAVQTGTSLANLDDVFVADWAVLKLQSIERSLQGGERKGQTGQTEEQEGQSAHQEGQSAKQIGQTGHQEGQSAQQDGQIQEQTVQQGCLQSPGSLNRAMSGTSAAALTELPGQNLGSELGPVQRPDPESHTTAILESVREKDFGEAKGQVVLPKTMDCESNGMVEVRSSGHGAAVYDKCNMVAQSSWLLAFAARERASNRNSDPESWHQNSGPEMTNPGLDSPNSEPSETWTECVQPSEHNGQASRASEMELIKVNVDAQHQDMSLTATWSGADYEAERSAAGSTSPLNETEELFGPVTVLVTMSNGTIGCPNDAVTHQCAIKAGAALPEASSCKEGPSSPPQQQRNHQPQCQPSYQSQHRADAEPSEGKVGEVVDNNTRILNRAAGSWLESDGPRMVGTRPSSEQPCTNLTASSAVPRHVDSVPLDSVEVSYTRLLYGHMLGNVLPPPPGTSQAAALPVLRDAAMSSLTLAAKRGLLDVHHSSDATSRVLRVMRVCGQQASRMGIARLCRLVGLKMPGILRPVSVRALREPAQLSRVGGSGAWVLTYIFARTTALTLGRVGSLLESLCPGLVAAHPDSWGWLVASAEADGSDIEVAQLMRLATVGLLSVSGIPLPPRALCLAFCIAAGAVATQVASNHPEEQTIELAAGLLYSLAMVPSLTFIARQDDWARAVFPTTLLPPPLPSHLDHHHPDCQARMLLELSDAVNRSIFARDVTLQLAVAVADQERVDTGHQASPELQEDLLARSCLLALLKEAFTTTGTAGAICR